MRLLNTTSIHPDLLAAQQYTYEPNGLQIKNVQQEKESHEYAACTFQLNGKMIQFRVAKITPTKAGLFVTLWKRSESGPIMPYDLNDSFDLVVVSVRDVKHFGQFVFPKNVLYERSFVSKEGIGGKRAMRVYPPWTNADNKQAKIYNPLTLKDYFNEVEIQYK